MVVIYLATLLLISTTSLSAESIKEYKVTLKHNGILVGRSLTARNGKPFQAFLGVPFALPPVNDLRFKAPIPFGPWSGERLAQNYSQRCIQKDEFFLETEVAGSEDCLYLNVFVPEAINKGDSLPVLVWLHGGGFIGGSTALYRPEYIMSRQVVFVTTNYRLGPLGFLSTETIDCPGNFGLKDQNLALRWVQEHISAFGGNPALVTIIGESAGSASVSLHMASKKSKGLFHKAILQSGAYENPFALHKVPGLAANNTKRLAAVVGCESTDKSWSEIVDCLKKISAIELVGALTKIREWDLFPPVTFQPIVEPEHDDAFLTISPQTLSQHHGDSLPILIGITADEGLLFSGRLFAMPNLLKEIRNRYSELLPLLLNYNHESEEVKSELDRLFTEFYFPEGVNFDGENFQNLTDMLGDSVITKGVNDYLLRRLESKTNADVFVYLFDHKGSLTVTTILSRYPKYLGTSHADDLLYLFPFAEFCFKTALTGTDLELSERVLDLFINFVYKGNPTPEGSTLPTWRPAKKYPPEFMHIGNGKNISETNLLIMNKGKYPVKRMEFWKQISLRVPYL